MSTFTSYTSSTQVEVQARIVSNLAWIGSRIESFGLRRFGDNATKSRLGMTYVLEQLGQRQKHFPYFNSNYGHSKQAL
jgi:hypothetical protein